MEGIAAFSVCTPVNNYICVCYNPVGLMNISPIGFQNWVIWETLSPRYESLKSLGCIVVVQTLHSSWIIWELGVLSELYGSLMGVCIFMLKICLSLSYLFQCCYSLSLPMCKSHSTSFWIPL